MNDENRTTSSDACCVGSAESKEREEATEVAMYQSPAIPAREAEEEHSSSFLSNMRPDFWDDF